MSDPHDAHPTAEIPAIYVWTAGKMAEMSGDAAKVVLLTTILETSKKGRESWGMAIESVRKLKMFAMSPPISIYIPFVRSSLDVYLSSLLIGDGSSSFKLYSDASLVDLGYIRVTSKEIVYVDKRRDVRRYDVDLENLFDYQKVKRVIELADAYPNTDLMLRTDHRDGRVLSILGEVNSLSIKVEKWPVPCSLSVWAAPEIDKCGIPSRRGSVVRKLGYISLDRQSDYELSLVGLSAERVMELTAASLVGQWILLEGDSYRFFGKLPDLTEPDLTQPLAFDPFSQFKKYSLQRKVLINVPRKLAYSMYEDFRWCVPEDPLAWLEVISK